MTQQEREGWFIVGSLFVIVLIVFAGGDDPVTVFIPKLVTSLGWNRTKVSILPSALAFSAGASVLIVGWLLDRVEARVVMVVGALIAGISFLIASQANSLSTMVVAYMMMSVTISAGTVVPGSFDVADLFVAPLGRAAARCVGSCQYSSEPPVTLACRWIGRWCAGTARGGRPGRA